MRQYVLCAVFVIDSRKTRALNAVDNVIDTDPRSSCDYRSGLVTFAHCREQCRVGNKARRADIVRFVFNSTVIRTGPPQHRVGARRPSPNCQNRFRMVEYNVNDFFHQGRKLPCMTLCRVEKDDSLSRCTNVAETNGIPCARMLCEECARKDRRTFSELFRVKQAGGNVREDFERVHRGLWIQLKVLLHFDGLQLGGFPVGREREEKARRHVCGIARRATSAGDPWG